MTLFAALYMKWLYKVENSQLLKYMWFYCQICCIFICTAHFANFKGILGFSAPSIRPTKTELWARRRKSWWWVEFLPMEGSRHCFILASDKNKTGQKNQSLKQTSWLWPEMGWSQATNLETQKQNKQIEIHQSQIKNHDLVNSFK